MERRRRMLFRAAAILLVPVLVAGGALMYLNERNFQQQAYELGDTAAKDRIDVVVSAQQVVPSTQRIQLRVLILPQGALAGSVAASPAKYLSVFTSSPSHSQIDFPADKTISAQDVDVTTYGGTVTDYPFDGYTTDITFAADLGGSPVPVAMYFTDIDPFFSFTPVRVADNNQGLTLVEHVGRSQGSQFLAGFMMLAMWALALSVLAGSWILVAQRRGLVWPALGWMAATLFALVGMRNNAPGNPPVGCVMDYTAFFWAELLTAIGVVAVSIRGFFVERRPAAEG